MIRRPLTEKDFTSSKWETKSSVVLDSGAHPGSLTLNSLGDNPFDLTSTALPPSTTNNIPLSTNTLRSRPYLPSNNNSLPRLDDPIPVDATITPDDIWMTAAAAKQPGWTRFASWDDDCMEEDEDTPMVDATRVVSASPFLTESNDCIEELYQLKYPDTVVVDQERLNKDVVYLLTGVPSLCFEWKQTGTKGSFQLRTTRIRLADVNADTMQHLLQPMILFGTRMKRLDHFIHHIQANPSVFGTIATSFVCCLGELVSYLQYSILSLFSSTTINGNQSQPLLDIHHRMEGFFLIMYHLTELCSIESSMDDHCIRGSDLLSLLYNKAHHLDDLQTGYLGFMKAIYLTLLFNTSTPWLTIMNRWLNDGTLYDPYNEFFITNNNTINEPVLDPSALPCFLSPQIAKLILRAGMSIQQQKKQMGSNTSLLPLHLSWLDPSWFPEKTTDTHSTKIHYHPLSLSLLPDPDTHLQQGRPSVITLEKWMNYQENNYVMPLAILLQQQLIDPIQHHCQSIDTSPTATSPETKGRQDLFFTYWNGHSDQHPTTCYVDIDTPPFTLATFLLEQRASLSKSTSQ
ncbi:Spc98 family-domain-containing protein [Chlamydoabsidia padenii]|nr:Spc98 family-domain-containing protein [Chlamydoabsidia padenii]